MAGQADTIDLASPGSQTSPIVVNTEPQHTHELRTPCEDGPEILKFPLGMASIYTTLSDPASKTTFETVGAGWKSKHGAPSNVASWPSVVPLMVDVFGIPCVEEDSGARATPPSAEKRRRNITEKEKKITTYVDAGEGTSEIKPHGEKRQNKIRERPDKFTAADLLGDSGASNIAEYATHPNRYNLPAWMIADIHTLGPVGAQLKWKREKKR